MSVLSAREVYSLARGAGLGHEAAIIATSISKGESGWNTEAVGDTTLTDATWGPSIGLWQVRSLKAESGTGRSRDAARLKSPQFNASSMHAISGGGSNWGPWSVYTNGSYRGYIAEVRRAVGSGSAPTVGTSPIRDEDGLSLGDVVGVGVKVPGAVAGGIGGVIGDGAGAVGDTVGGLAGGVVSALVKTMTPALLIGAGILGGFALIAVGAWRGTEADPKRRTDDELVAA